MASGSEPGTLQHRALQKLFFSQPNVPGSSLDTLYRIDSFACSCARDGPFACTRSDPIVPSRCRTQQKHKLLPCPRSSVQRPRLRTGGGAPLSSAAASQRTTSMRRRRSLTSTPPLASRNVMSASASSASVSITAIAFAGERGRTGVAVIFVIVGIIILGTLSFTMLDFLRGRRAYHRRKAAINQALEEKRALRHKKIPVPEDLQPVGAPAPVEADQVDRAQPAPRPPLSAVPEETEDDLAANDSPQYSRQERESMVATSSC